MANRLDERPDFQEKGAWISSGDSGGRFQRTPSYYWNKFKCRNFPDNCKACRRYFDDCGLSGVIVLMYSNSDKDETEGGGKIE